MKFVVYVKNWMLNEKLMEYLILNICMIFYSFSYRIISLFSALKNQMTIVQTLSDNNQSKLDHNEQQMEQVISYR